jgi:hypothetical protein
MHDNGYKGEEQKILVIENIFDLNHMKDSFEDRGYAPQSNEYQLLDRQRHGRIVCDIIFQQAPKAKIIPMEHHYFYKFYDNKEILADIDAINISFHPNNSYQQSLLIEFMKLASKLDIPVFIAAGNDNEQFDENESSNAWVQKLTELSNQPEHIGKIIIVASSERDYDETEKCIKEELAKSSGECINAKSFITFPGKNVYVHLPPNSFRMERVSGTSLAAPSAAANYLLLKEFYKKNNIDISPQDIGNLMLDNARKDDLYDSRCGAGYGDICFAIEKLDLSRALAQK